MVGDTTGEASERHINDKGGLEKHHPSENCRARFTESCASLLMPTSLSTGRRGQLCGMISAYSSGGWTNCTSPSAFILGLVDEIKKHADPAVVRTLKAKSAYAEFAGKRPVRQQNNAKSVSVGHHTDRVTRAVKWFFLADGMIPGTRSF